MTNEDKHYRAAGKEIMSHSRIHHTPGQYVDPENAAIQADISRYTLDCSSVG